MSVKLSLEILMVVLVVGGAIGQFIIQRLESKESSQVRIELLGKIDKLQGTLEERNQRIAELDRRVNVINSLEIRVSLDEVTQERPVSDVETCAGKQSAVSLFNKDKTRFRFVTDFQFSFQQVSKNLRRAFFVYRPEEPTQILGRNIGFLEATEKLAANYSDFLEPIGFDPKNQTHMISISFLLNGLETIFLNNIEIAETLSAGQFLLDVNQTFKDISEKYSRQFLAKDK